MGYYLDLDEYDEDVLEDEITRRKELRKLGLCDYCKRSIYDTSCKFKHRHNKEKINVPT